MWRRPALLATALVCLPFGQAPGQTATPALAQGARIRWILEGDHTWNVGTVVRAHLDTVLALRVDSGQSVKVLGSELRELDLSRGRASRGRGAFKGGRIGLIAGVGAAIVAGIATGCLNGPYDAFNQRASNNVYCIRWGAAGIVAGFTAVGALIGDRLPPRENWVKVPLNRLQVGLAPGRARLFIRL
jgi:hypothetical protein